MKNTFTFLVALFTMGCHPQSVDLQFFKSGFQTITDIAHPVGDARLFVVEQSGKIKILNPNQTVNAASFLTIPASSISYGIESGLLGLAFHPNYANNGYFFVCYISAAGNTVVARYSVSANPNIANPAGTVVLSIPQSLNEIHRGGSLRFSPNGYLYIGLGDNADPNGAQDINKYNGKILRINVNSSTPTTPYYSIPPDNPYVGINGLDEIWATGLRNPWRINFNRLNGDMWIADVGESTEEEINKVNPAATGLNFGWNCYEGNTAGVNCTPEPSFTFPVASYSTVDIGSGAITGGYPYTGTTYPTFSGKYFFSDLYTDQIGYISDVGGAITWSVPFTFLGGITSFGEDRNGELYVGTFSGSVYKVIDSNLATQSFARTSLELYPNPALSEVHLNAPNLKFPATANVFDVSGKWLSSQLLESATNAITTSALQSGVYLVSVTDANGATFNSKLMIQ